MDVDSFRGSGADVAAFHAVQTDRPAKTKPNTKRPSVDLPKHGKGERFIRGPIPLEWMKLASQCGNRSEAVAVLLWYSAGLQRSNPVRLSANTLAELRVRPRTAKRVLLKMISFGLVNAEFRRGKSPIVTLLDPKPIDGQLRDE